MSAETPKRAAVEDNPTYMKDGRLYNSELFWRDHQPWLKESGYLLRPRYHPEWVASWKGTDKYWGNFEDAQIGKVREAHFLSPLQHVKCVMIPYSKPMCLTQHALKMGRLSC